VGDTVYRIDSLRDRVVAALRKKTTHTTKGDLAVELKIPLYAVEAGLEAAIVGGLAIFAGGGFWADGVARAMGEEVQGD
jgi:hypothetical protein